MTTAAHAGTSPPGHDDVATVYGVATAYLHARALHTVTELGVADALGDTPATAEALARTVHADPDALERLLRLLADHDVFARDSTGHWHHTGASRLLRDDDPRSLRAFVRMIGGPPMWNSFTSLEHTARTGEPGPRAGEPGGLWAHLDTSPEQLTIFDQAMTARARHDAATVVDGYDFSRHRRICDVAGGRGHLIAAVLHAHPGVRGVLFDLPRVVAAAEPAAGLDTTSGDVFTDPLPVADAYLLMQVIHDWDDADATAILAAVTSAAPDAATVLLLEWLRPDDNRPHPVHSLDVMMLATTGGRERSATEYRALLDSAGIDLITIHPTGGPLSILEGRVRPALQPATTPE